MADTQAIHNRASRAVWAIVLLSLIPAFCRAGYPSPKEAGFHHCALIYDTPNRAASDLMPYVAWAEDG
ncbi:MAG: hypothetical protein HN904_17140, partial [Victivallales bacterium]|nr:hypothetical protein [Victivallales bacterium]